MDKRFFFGSGIISIFLYCILGFVEEAIEKSLLAKLTVGNVGFGHDDFLLHVSSYKAILLAAAGVCMMIAVICAIGERRKRKDS